MATLGQRLRHLRRQAGLTQIELAQAFDPPRFQNEISRWESGIVRIPAEDLPVLARKLGVPEQAFYTPCEEEPVHAY